MSDFEIVNFIKNIEQETGIDIRTKTRKRNYVYSRIVFFEILKKANPNMTFMKLGSFVNMHHSSVMYWFNSKTNLEMYDDYAQIANTIKSIKAYKSADNVAFCNPKPYLHGQN
jgi:chromosomal replication initiation ATPase DnaA